MQVCEADFVILCIHESTHTHTHRRYHTETPNYIKFTSLLQWFCIVSSTLTELLMTLGLLIRDGPIKDFITDVIKDTQIKLIRVSL